MPGRKSNMVTVNHNYLKLPGSYLFSTIGKKVKAYKEANPQANVISLGIGDVTQPLAPAIIEALHKSVDEMGDAATFHGYAPDLGYEFLRSAIAKNDYKDRGCDIEADEIFVSDGAKSDSGNIQEIFSVDNRIAVCDPVYPVYVDSNVMAGRTGTYDPKSETWSDVIYMPCLAENGFAPELPKETPDLIYLCFPNNPTGAVMEREDLEAVAEVLRDTNVMVLSDEIYAELNYGLRPHVSIATLPGMAERTIVVNGFSKTYAMTGWRLGYACGPAPIIRIMTKIHQSAIMSAPTTSQYAAITALKECDGEIDRMRDEYNMRRRLVVKSFNDMGLTCFEPRGAFYAFPCIKSTGMTSQEFCTKLLEQKHVAIIPGDAFGASGEGYCRVSYAYSVEHLTEALKRIREFLQENGLVQGN